VREEFKPGKRLEQQLEVLTDLEQRDEEEVAISNESHNNGSIEELLEGWVISIIHDILRKQDVGADEVGHER
jgi:hypothetical protein